MDDILTTSTAAFDNESSTSDIPYRDISEFKVSIYIRLVATVILVPTATIGNVLSFLVMQSKALRGTTTSLYLSYLAVADLLTIYFVCVPDTIAKFNGIFIQNVTGFLCTFYTIQRQFLIELTSWILLLLAVERATAICFPVRARTIFSFRNSILIALVTTLALLALNLRSAWTRRLVGKSCKPVEPYLEVESKVFPYVIRSLYWIIPFCVMTFCNTCILLRIRIMMHSKIGNAKSRITSNTIIMVVTTVAFCVLCGPQTLFYQFNPGWNYEPPLQKAKFELGYSICQVLSYTNNAINFFLYVASGPRFRSELMRILRIKPVSVSPMDGRSVTFLNDTPQARNPNVPTLTVQSARESIA